MTWRHRLLLNAAVAVLLSCAAAGAALWIREPAAAPTTAIGGPFTLTAADGTTVTDRTYRGKWLLIYFGYTFCPDACPTALSAVSGALERLGPVAARIQPLFITVDPQRDTPAVMGDYVKAFAPGIVGLTGTPAQIAAVAREYGVYVAPHRDEGPNYLVDHSSLLYVITPDGNFATTLSGAASSTQIADRLKQLVASTS